MPPYLDLDPSEILPLSLKHNFWTWSAQARVQPIPVTRAERVHFWDAEGKRYLDFNSMVMCSNIGHGEKRVIEAMVEQTRRMEIRAYNLLRGVRGEKPSDLDAIADTLVRVSQLVTDFPDIMELYINPLLVFPVGQGVLGLDMRLALKA